LKTSITNKIPQDFQRRFGGVARVYGESSLECFTQAHIIVIGIGGVGSWVVEALARNAIGKLTLIDMDVIAESNINRQLPALSTTLGRDKTTVMKERVLNINEACKVRTIDDFLTEENISQLIDENADYVIDCIDNSRIKAALIAWCKRNKLPIITIGGAGGQIDPEKIKVADLSRTEHDPLLSKTRKLLRQQYNFATNPKRRFGVACAFSTEHLRYPSDGGKTTQDKPGDKSTNLSCAGGIGSSVMVTATFGFVTVAFVLKKINNK